MIGKRSNLAIWFAIHVIFRAVVSVEAGPLSLDLPVPGSIDWLAASLAVFALFAVFRLKIGMGMALGGSAVLGVGLWLIGLI